ncbi:MAG: ImmA/IrrE family metallo-endopeptidase [Proteobacteria bacterium]|nr:ImmA/IrrE family metallo-endopeptidase [Pseudomonadota bacterium]
MAEKARGQLGLSPIARLDPWAYADSLGIFVRGADELDLPSIHVQQLLVNDSDSWSGMTLKEDGIVIVVLNSSHARTRQSSTLMHEVSHVVLEHVPASVEVSSSGLLLLSEFSEDQEDEANWLMGALLLPRPALLQEQNGERSLTDIAMKFEISEDLVRWRLRMTGVDRQLRRRRA